MNDIIKNYAESATKASIIDTELYQKYNVKRGLRDISGKGVLAGLTEISEISSYVEIDNDIIPCDGKLFYRGYNIKDLTSNIWSDGRFGFEEIVFLLIVGHLPSKNELSDFNNLLFKEMALPKNFVRDVIMKAPSSDIMNGLTRSVLTLYSYDDNADDISVENVIRQSISLIAKLPLLAVYCYQANKFMHHGENLNIQTPLKDLSLAENILHLLHPNRKFSKLESRILDIALILHAEHGGGNNSTFTNHVVTSSGTDTYSALACSLCSLKGPRHGGANIKVVKMFDDLKQKVDDWEDDDKIEKYLHGLLNKTEFDKKGLIYGMGHAVYSISDPRAIILKQFVELLASEKGMEKEFNLYKKVNTLASKVIAKERKIYKGVSANVDFYSGLLYCMLDIPPELYTPLFAIARTAGWSAHRIEELSNGGKIIRPAYKSVAKHNKYISLDDR